MRNEDVKIGMKVVPFQKTTKKYEDLSNSAVWNKAKEKRQPFLYVAKKVPDGMFVLYDDVVYNAGLGGDYFNACDFELYIVKQKKSTTKNIKHIITGNKTIVVIHNEDGTYKKGEARCDPQDKFNKQEGFRIAYCRAIGKKPFENATMSDNEKSKEDNKKKIIDGKLQVDKKLWKQFLNGHIAIYCKTEGDANKLINCCKQQGITCTKNLITYQIDLAKYFNHDACYYLFNNQLITMRGNEIPSLVKAIIKCDTMFPNKSSSLSQFTNEELLEELESRLNKNN